MSRNDMVLRFEVALNIEKQGFIASLHEKGNYFPNDPIAFESYKYRKWNNTLTFPQVNEIPLGLRSLKSSVTCLLRIHNEPPHACSSFSPIPNILMSRFMMTPNGKRRSRRQQDTGDSSRPIGSLIRLILATWLNQKFITFSSLLINLLIYFFQ